MTALDMSPPPLAASSCGKSHFKCSQIRLTTPENRRNCSAVTSPDPPASTLASLTSLSLPPARPCRISPSFFKATKHKCFVLRNFDTELHYPYCYGFELNARLESVA